MQFFYDPTVISYGELLQLLWQAIDPTDDGGQFVDRGFSYTTAVFYHDESQRDATMKSIAELESSGRLQGRAVITEVLPFTTFYRAEEFHQDYYIKAPEQYERYESNSGRDAYKAAVWADIQSSKQN